MSEHPIQNEIRNALAGECICFRANVGKAWTGDVSRLPDGSILLRNPRPFSSGLPVGFSDLVGLVPVVITQDMVGETIGQAMFLEVKTAKGRTLTDQSKFIAAMKAQGAIAGVVRSSEEALAMVRGVLRGSKS